MGITAAQLVALVKVSGVEESAAKLASMGGTVDSVGGKLGGLATGAVLVAGAAFVGLGAVLTKMAGDFQATTETLVTGAGEQQSALDMVRQGILRTAVDTATGTQPLINAMFTIESAGYRGAQGLTVLKDVAEEAKVGQADLGNTAQVTTVALHNYHLAVSQAVPVLNSFNATVKQGDMHLTDLNAALINVLPAAQAARVKLTDVEGALATMSVSGDRGAAAGTHLSQMFLSLEKPSSAATKVLKEVGLTTQQISDDMQKSLPDTIQLIYDALAKKFPPGSAAFNAAAATIVGGTRQMKAWNELTGQSFADLTQKTGIISAAYRQGGQDVSGWAAVQDEFNTKLGRAGEVMETLGIKAGTQLLPIFSKMLDAVTPLIVSFSNWIDKDNVLTNAFNTTVSAVQSSINFYQQWKPIIDTTAGALAFFFVPALIKSGVEALISAGKITYGYVTSLIATGFEGWSAAFKLAAYIGAVIATGVQAVISAGKITFNFIASLIATGVQAYVAAYAVSGSFVPALGMVGMQAVAAGGKLTGSLIPALAQTGVAATSTGVTVGGMTALLGLLGGALAIGAIETYLLKDATVALGESWRNPAYKPPSGPGGIDPARYAHNTQGIIANNQSVSSSANQMKASVTGSANQMTENVDAAFTRMANQTYSNTSALTQNAIQNFQNLNGDLTSQMSTIDANVIGYWNDVANYIASHEIVGHVTYTTAGGDIGVQQSPTTAHNAEGTDNWRGGWSWVGEKGPELMNIPRGAQIIPHDRSVAASGAGPINLKVDVYLDGYRTTKQLMPHIAHILHDSMGTRF